MEKRYVLTLTPTAYLELEKVLEFIAEAYGYERLKTQCAKVVAFGASRVMGHESQIGEICRRCSRYIRLNGDICPARRRC